MTTAKTAAEAYDRYTKALDEGLLIQKAWHVEEDGRHLACALGVIGDEVTSASACPADVMPRWLAQMVPWFFDNQERNDALSWGKRFYAALAALDGKVPFEVVYDWHANFVCPMGMEAATKRGKDPKPHAELKALHERALNGDRAPRDEWHNKLRNANAYANANAVAYAYAYAVADAYANANAVAYAYAYADANANAVADAVADASYRQNIKTLADGMCVCLERA